MEKLKLHIQLRADLVQAVRSLQGLDKTEGAASPIQGGRKYMQERLEEFDVAQYARKRNFLGDAVSQLSPYVSGGCLPLSEFKNHILNSGADPSEQEKIIQQLSWRDYFARYARQNPGHLWHDIEDYKTGFMPDDYQDDLTDDVLNAKTASRAINHFIETLVETGYLHNHARLYLASYIVHFKRIKWQAGAKFFLHHLLDGDVASNNLSFQWVASTFSNKPYIFNLENVQKYSFNTDYTNSKDNAELDKSYEDLNEELFPNLKGGDDD